MVFKPSLQGDRDMKLIITISVFLLSACSLNPIIDPKGSTNPQNIIEDKMACEYIIKESSIWDRTSMMYATCLEGRGHSVINYHGAR